jgi:uncharacterized phage protein (TIGR02218 family)
MTTPFELYQFTEEGTDGWTYTSADDKITYNNLLYLPIAIGRDEIESKNELSKSNITVSVSLDNAMGRRWLKNAGEKVVGLTIFTLDQETNNVMVAWKGRLASVKPNDKSIQLYFESIFTSLRRAGVRLRYQRTCPHVLYGNGCRVNKAPYMLDTIVNTVSGINVVIYQPAQAAEGWYTGGIFESDKGVRFITAHKGDNITLNRPIDGLAASDFVKLYPGCDRSVSTCHTKFNNLLNNGSFPYIPNKNPFSLTSLV